MTRYYTLVSDELLDAARWDTVDGFRFIEAGMSANGSSVVLFEDDGAPSMLEGKTVTPTFEARYDPDTGEKRVVVKERYLWTEIQ